MGKLRFFDKLVFIVNSLFATALLLGYVLPYIPPETFPFLSILNLGIPILLVINLAFLLYWIIKLKIQFLLSFLVLLLGFNHLLSLYRFSPEVNKDNAPEDFSLMSYNVRQFNRFQWIKNDTVPQSIINFIKKESPDIVCIQDYYQKEAVDFSDYPYQYKAFKKHKTANSKFGQAIFSKFPIINKGDLNFPNTYNNVIYADLKVGADTIRVFNIHLESLKIDPSVSELQKEDSEKLITRVGQSFRKQQLQTETLLKEVKQTPYKTIIAGDLNNSAFSYVYQKISEGFLDAFKVAGKGFGKTFVFDFIPLRIDVVLVEPDFEIKAFKNYNIQLSDHYPIMTRLKLQTR
ncbi:endonuclease/exonuclease/phosphatase family protein [Haloflavibacter putidus]|uniref:Endonuclease/exonuclease/phosphatase family protein n=1 Tax=Haloflavibacter putidus TaxID=2576776 RepID=A0A507ZE96_9FLAO|nr:endonuclease/exonuclease/phosphatase family protein [Haloflavibacter putidus]TQD35419.1 endonuclease/exonuclease/phosphatase family protein [Haloflavibacter putidus]